MPELQFSNALSEIEDAYDPIDTVLSLAVTLKEFLDKEEARIEDEVTFLKEVHAGISGGAALESASTVFTDSFLAQGLNELFPSD